MTNGCKKAGFSEIVPITDIFYDLINFLFYDLKPTHIFYDHWLIYLTVYEWDNGGGVDYEEKEPKHSKL